MELLISYKMKLLTRSFVILLDRVSNFLNGKNSDARMSLPYGLAMFAFSKSTLVFDRNFYSELEFEMVAFSLSPISCVTTAKQYASAFPVLNISRASPTLARLHYYYISFLDSR